MTASQETDRAHRAETPCGDLRPFAENVGGDAGVLRGCVRVLFFCAFTPRAGGVVCSPECESVRKEVVRKFRRMPHAPRRSIAGCTYPSAGRMDVPARGGA